MAAASRFSKSAKHMLSFSGLPLVVSLLDLLPFPFLVFDFDSICALYTIFSLDFGHTPRSKKGAQSWCLYIDSAHTIPTYILILDGFRNILRVQRIRSLFYIPYKPIALLRRYEDPRAVRYETPTDQRINTYNIEPHKLRNYYLIHV